MRKVQAATLVTLTLIAGCSGSSKTGPSPQLTDATAQTIGSALADEVGQMAAQITVTGVTQPLISAPAMVRPAGAAPMRVNGPCPVVSSTTDSDGDGVPDDATYSYTGLPDCGYVDSTTTTEVTGSLRITDPSTTQVGYDATLTNLTLASTSPTYSFSIKLNGTQDVLGDAANVTLSHHLTTDLSATGNGQSVTGRLDENWNVAFAAAQGSAIAMDTPLPSGTLNINGSFGYNVNGENFSFALATQTGLQYDSSCGLSYPFSAGELRATVNSNSGNAYIQIVYHGCGVTPTVTLVASNA